jgi:hypothetical protein
MRALLDRVPTARTIVAASIIALTVVVALVVQTTSDPARAGADVRPASEPGGANGPIMEELAAAAPSAKYVARKGEVSSDYPSADINVAVDDQLAGRPIKPHSRNSWRITAQEGAT